MRMVKTTGPGHCPCSEAEDADGVPPGQATDEPHREVPLHHQSLCHQVNFPGNNNRIEGKRWWEEVGQICLQTDLVQPHRLGRLQHALEPHGQGVEAKDNLGECLDPQGKVVWAPHKTVQVNAIILVSQHLTHDHDGL